MRFTDDKGTDPAMGDRLAEIEQRLRASHDAIEEAAETRRAVLERLARRAAERAEEGVPPEDSEAGDAA